MSSSAPLETEVAICIAGNVDAGKCFAKGTRILKYDGSVVNVEDIQIGDLLVGPDSCSRTVTEFHSGISELYKITTSDGFSYIVNGSHLLCLKNSNKQIVNISVNDYNKLSYEEQQQLKWFRTTVNLDHFHDNLELDPYLIGFWINFESSTNFGLVSFDLDDMEYFRKNLPDCGFEFVTQSFVEIPKYRVYNSKMLNFITLNNLSDHKQRRIPNKYLFNSPENRLAFLAGIIDSSGHFNDSNCIIWIDSQCKALIESIILLIRSLGFELEIENHYLGDFIKLTITGSLNSIPSKIYKHKKYEKSSDLCYNISVSEYSVDKYYGFETTGDHLFLLADCSVVHNSTFIGVMKYGELDDGNGSSRVKVAKHPHEKNSGKTSDISTRVIECDDGKRGVTFIDLCGHEKYLKTTSFGINGYFPDYSFPIVAANRGVMKMTKEHLGMLFYLEIPTFILITRIDLVHGMDIYNETLKVITKICKHYQKQVIILNTDKEFTLPIDELKQKEEEANNKVIKLCETMQESVNIVPILTISCKTGYYLNTVRTFINNAKPRKLWNDKQSEGVIFYIDQVFSPPGIGIVISGIVKGTRSIKIGDHLYIGPNGKEFALVKVKSIHNDNRQELSELKNHQRGCIAITCIDKKIEFSRSYIRKGMSAVYPEELTSKICYKFKAEIDVLHNSTTIKSGYSSFIHIGPVCQTARLTFDSETGLEALRTGDRAIVNFKFIFKPEFVETFEETGKYFFFREGSTRGKGKVLSITKIIDDPDPNPEPNKAKKRRMRVKKQLPQIKDMINKGRFRKNKNIN